MPIFNFRNPIEYPLGLLETLAAGASGAAGNVVGVPAGLLKAVRSGEYGTPRGVQTAQAEAKRIAEAMTYQPRTEAAGQLTGLLSDALTASKIPPVLPEAQALGAMALQPQQAYVAQGMNVEKALEPFVAKTMERGGLPAHLLEGMAQGSRSQIFIGPEAKTWRKTDAFKAAQLEKQKVAPEEIWRQTGTFRGPDGFWRQEIDDSTSKFVDAEGIAAKAQALRDERAALKETLKQNRSGQQDLFPKQLTEARKPLRAREQALNQELNVDTYGPTMSPEYRGNLAPYAFEHSALYEAYPELRNVVVKQGTQGSPGLHGSYGRGKLDVTRLGLKNDPRSTTAHEMQHAVQDIEGFSPGGNQQYAYGLAQEAWNKIGALNDAMSHNYKYLSDASLPAADRQRYRTAYENAMASREKLVPFTLGSTDPYQAYRNLLGETEARAVQSRLGLSGLQRRERFPLLDYETKPGDLIIPQHEDLFRPSLLD